jgi:hypothetical protein
MFAAPIKGTLKNFVEFGESGVACHEQTPPHQPTHATKHDAKLVDRDGCREGSDTPSRLPKLSHTYRLEFDPPESPALGWYHV